MYNQNQYRYAILEQSEDLVSEGILRKITCIYKSEAWVCIFIKLFPKSLKITKFLPKTSQSTDETNNKKT